jgi:MFS transporter, DHA2 family, multidrug resistance protein
VVGTAVYRGEVSDAVPADVPHEPADAARDTLGGAVSSGDELPEPLGRELVDAASEAFTQALQLVAALSAAAVLAAAVLAWALLRRVVADPAPGERRLVEVERPVADRSPCWPARSGIPKALDESGA